MSSISGLEPGPGLAAPRKTAGEHLEGIAFTFCKAATVILFTGRFALPVAAGLASVLYAAAHLKGKHDTRCILRKPLLICGFWGTISLVSLTLILRPELGRQALTAVGLATPG